MRRTAAQEVHAFIRSSIAQEWNKDFADRRAESRYGGSMKPKTRAAVHQPDVEGRSDRWSVVESG